MIDFNTPLTRGLERILLLFRITVYILVPGVVDGNDDWSDLFIAENQDALSEEQPNITIKVLEREKNLLLFYCIVCLLTNHSQE